MRVDPEDIQGGVGKVPGTWRWDTPLNRLGNHYARVTWVEEQTSKRGNAMVVLTLGLDYVRAPGVQLRYYVITRGPRWADLLRILEPSASEALATGKPVEIDPFRWKGQTLICNVQMEESVDPAFPDSPKVVSIANDDRAVAPEMVEATSTDEGDEVPF